MLTPITGFEGIAYFLQLCIGTQHNLLQGHLLLFEHKEFLLFTGANVHICANGVSPLEIAKGKGFTDVESALIEAGEL